MREIYLINKYKFRSILNRFLYIHKNGGMHSVYLPFLVGSIIITVTLTIINFFTSYTVEFMLGNLEPLTRKEQSEWAYRLFLLIILFILTSNVYSNVYRMLELKDFKLLSSIVPSVNKIILSKLIGRELFKSLLLFVIFVLFFIHIATKLNFSLATGMFLFLFITPIILIVATLKIYIVMKIISAKVSKRIGLNYSLFLLFTKIIITILFFSILFPFIEYIPSSLVRENYLLIYNHYIIQSLLVFFNPFHFISDEWTILSISLFIGICICWLMGKSLKHLEVYTYIVFFQRNNSNVTGTEIRNSLFNLYLSRLSMVLKYLKFIPILTRKIVEKDYKHFQRIQMYRFNQTFLLIIFQYILIFIPYYLLASKNISFIEGNHLSIFAILHLSGAVMVIHRLFNRFSPDFEGKSFVYLLLTPVRVEDICLAKVLSLLGVALPFSIIVSSATCLVFDVNFLLILPLNLFTTVVTILIALVSSITFPNYERETYLDLPSTRSSIMSKFLSSLFIIIGSLIIMLSKNSLLTVILFSSMAFMISSILFHLCCKKLTNSEFKNFSSLSEFSE
ncbi:hypothetical protein [Bacillus safensis]|uniref:Uncharacterized protein n=1 Tax=Bacillus safensis TaxID=561879 RepID=A0A1L6ZLY2_BACIA|nr:hypothetical protein [Bacillus safensis]APT47527.1 hypothetical protein BSA145_17640 [Bacillus safensis]